MQQLLIHKLHDHLRQFYPELLLGLQDQQGVTPYLREKVEAVLPLAEQLRNTGTPRYIIEEECLHFLIADLGPSRYNYLQNLVEEEFETTYYLMSEAGVLTYELINLVGHCKDLFDALDFCEANEEDRKLRYAIMGHVQEYLELMNQPHGV